MVRSGFIFSTKARWTLCRIFLVILAAVPAIDFLCLRDRFRVLWCSLLFLNVVGWIYYFSFWREAPLLRSLEVLNTLFILMGGMRIYVKRQEFKQTKTSKWFVWFSAVLLRAVLRPLPLALKLVFVALILGRVFGVLEPSWWTISAVGLAFAGFLTWAFIRQMKKVPRSGHCPMSIFSFTQRRPA